MRQKLYLVRHCEAAGQAPDAPLTNMGKQQAIALANWLSKLPIQRIISSPYARAHQSVAPLSQQLGMPIELDDRLIERVLSPVPIDDWRDRLAESFIDLDLNIAGGESSRTAMARGVAVVHQALAQGAASIVIATHGNLIALILKHYDDQIGFADWARLRNPDVYCLRFDGAEVVVELMTP